jgi:nickel/cobalt tolerance cation efflux system protein
MRLSLSLSILSPNLTSLAGFMNVMLVSRSFENRYIVVYRWLKDHHQWNADIVTLLKEDLVEDALSELSDVWTSLGSGLEDNLMTPFLPKLYRKFLAEELASTSKISGSQMINKIESF